MDYAVGGQQRQREHQSADKLAADSAVDREFTRLERTAGAEYFRFPRREGQTAVGTDVFKYIERALHETRLAADSCILLGQKAYRNKESHSTAAFSARQIDLLSAVHRVAASNGNGVARDAHIRAYRTQAVDGSHNVVRVRYSANCADSLGKPRADKQAMRYAL